MSDETTTIDTGATVEVPDGEVTHDQLVKILTDAGGATLDDPTEEAAAEPVAEPEPPKQVEPSVSARIIASRRAEMRAKAEREAIAKDRADTAKERAQVADLAAVAEQVKAAKLSPSKALELLGMDAKTFLETLAGENEPEAIAKRAMSATELETKRLSEELKALRAERDQERVNAQRAEYQREVAGLQSNFVKHVESTDSYPHLVAEYTPDEIVKVAWEVANNVAKNFRAQHGRAPTPDESPTDPEIAKYLERQAKARAEKRAAWHAQIGKNVPNPSQGHAATQGPPSKAITPRTLTNGLSSQKASATKPWSQADADAESKRILQQMYSEASDD